LGKPPLVNTLVVCFLRENPFLVQEVLNSVVQCLHADLLARLHGRRNLEGFRISDQVADRRRADKDFQGCATPFFVRTLEQVLRNNELQCGG
jgi:hypothetical protein